MSESNVVFLVDVWNRNYIESVQITMVDPVLKANTPVYEYQAGTWGPAEVPGKVAPPSGWHDPSGDA